jgi:hypothetical protein
VKVALDFPPEFVNALVEHVLERLGERSASDAPWLDIDQAAHYTSFPKARLYKLTAAEAVFPCLAATWPGCGSDGARFVLVAREPRDRADDFSSGCGSRRMPDWDEQLDYD